MITFTQTEIFYGKHTDTKFYIDVITLHRIP